MLNKLNRLSTKFEFNVTRKYGKHVTTPLFHLFYLEPRNYRGPTRVGFVVSNKFSKSAVKRNRVKRIYREVVRNLFDRINDNYWIVMHPKNSILKPTYESINTEFAKTLQKIPFARHDGHESLQV